MDAHERSRGDARSAPARHARSREAHLGARLSRIVGPWSRRSRRFTATRMRVTMFIRCLAMMRGGGETRHLAWIRELSLLGVEVDVVTGHPLIGAPRHALNGMPTTIVRSPYTRDAVYRWQNRRGFGRLTMAALHADEEWFCRAAWRRVAAKRVAPDVVHAHALYQTARLRRAGVPVRINLPGEPHPP